MSQTLVTVIIPTFNRSHFLQEAIHSVIEQSYKDFKIFVVDNASTDNTSEIVNSINDDRITYYRNDSNIGMQQNWRYALSLPDTPYIAILEDDNLFLKDHLKSAVAALEKYPNTVCYASAIETFGSKDSRICKALWLKDISELDVVSARNNPVALLRGTPFASSAMVLRKSAISKIEQWGGKSWPVCMDYLWWGQLIMKEDFLFDPKIGARYRWHESNLSHSWYNNFRLEAVEYRYTIRTLANYAARYGLITEEQIYKETLSWSARDISTLITSLAVQDAEPILRKAAIRLFYQRKELKKRGASGHTRLAGVIGSWYLKFADRFDRLIAKWPPKIIELNALL